MLPTASDADWGGSPTQPSRAEVSCTPRATRRAFLGCACVLFPGMQLWLLADALAAPASRPDACARRTLALAALGSALVVGALAALAVRLENVHLLLSCALSSLVPLGRSWHAGTAADAAVGEEVLFAAAALLELSVFALAVTLWRGFGWRAYTVVGGDVALNALYSSYQRLEAVIALSAEFLLLLCLAAHASGSVEAGGALGLAAVALTLAPVQLVAARAERSGVLAAAVAGQGGVLLANVALFGRYRERTLPPSCWLCDCAEPAGASTRHIALGACVAAAAAMVALALVALRVASNFGRGLRQRAFDHHETRREATGGGGRGQGRFAIQSPSARLADFAAEPMLGEDAEDESERWGADGVEPLVAPAFADFPLPPEDGVGADGAAAGAQVDSPDRRGDAPAAAARAAAAPAAGAAAPVDGSESSYDGSEV
ncbi:hypothetical protein T492DRAFT_905688 [Pavlovales sp. CCMP2436]|nr:hypothetical protein T492DRAFT_905688 [Pavlovales sp. CCMP2436]